MLRVQLLRHWVLPAVMVGGGFLSSLPCPGADLPVIVRTPGSSNAKAKEKPNGSTEGKVSDRPEWSEIEKTVKATLAQTKDYRPGDLLTQKDASMVFQALNSSGWKVKPKDLAQRMLPASDEMARQLQGNRGTKFMREIAGVPGGYDRLDKLRKLPDGSRRLRELVEQPGGSKMIQYMATTPGGKKMGRELSSRTRGDFNASTKRIYTETDLLGALKLLYTAKTSDSTETAAPAPCSPRSPR